MRSSKMAAGSGRAAILRLRLNGGRKTRPKSWLTSFPAPPSWIQDGGATRNVWRTLGLPWNLQKGVVLVQKTSLRCLKLFFFYFLRSIWSLASPNHWLRELPACHYGELISLHMSTPRSMKRGVDYGKHLLYFFLDSMLFFLLFFYLYSTIV